MKNRFIYKGASYLPLCLCCDISVQYAVYQKAVENTAENAVPILGKAAKFLAWWSLREPHRIPETYQIPENGEPALTGLSEITDLAEKPDVVRGCGKSVYANGRPAIK